MSRARRSRLSRRLSLACLAAAFVVGVVADPGSADAPVKQGWWSRWQLDPTTSSTTPSTIGVNPPPQSVPAPPTGDDGGLTVANEVDGPAAIAAMFFQTEGGGDASLYLPAAPRKKAGTPEPPPDATSSTVPTTLPSTSPVQPPPPPDKDTIVLPPGATVLACRALSSWDRENNGPWSKRPTWDAAECVPGTLVGGGTAMFWTLFQSMQDEDGNYDVVLVPNAPPPSSPPVTSPVPGVPSQQPQQAPAQPAFMVNFASPGANTLAVDPDEEEETTTTVEEPPPDDSGDGDVVADSGGDDFALASPDFVPAATPLAPSVSTPAPRPTTLANSGRRFFPRRPILFPDSRAERIMAVSLLLFMAMALWWYGGGSPVRSPRLLGAAAGRSPAASPSLASLRGIGRFARERLKRPPRL